MKTMHIRVFFLIVTLMAGILSGCAAQEQNMRTQGSMCKLVKKFYIYMCKELHTDGKEANIINEVNEEINKKLGLPPLDAKNPYRFW